MLTLVGIGAERGGGRWGPCPPVPDIRGGLVGPKGPGPFMVLQFARMHFAFEVIQTIFMTYFLIFLNF